MESTPTPAENDPKNVTLSEEELSLAREQFLAEAKALADKYSVLLEDVLHIFAASEGRQFESINDEATLHKLFTPDNLRDSVRFELVEAMLNLEISKKEAVIDALTGLFNRGALDIELKRHAEAFARDYDSTNGTEQEKIKPFSLIFVDLDDFKMINDTFGHPVGDAVLKSVSEIIISNLRPTDFAGRYGGEEIAIIVDGNAGNAAKVAERMRNDIESLKVAALGINPDIREKVTASFGVSEYKHTGNTEQDVKSLTERADVILYEAKYTGKNKVLVSKDDPSP